MQAHECASAAAERPRISPVADGPGGVEVRWPEGRVTPLRMDEVTVAPDPPCSMTFSGDNDASGCDLVWLEIPFPDEAELVTSATSGAELLPSTSRRVGRWSA
jgi:hypothetical protein